MSANRSVERCFSVGDMAEIVYSLSGNPPGQIVEVIGGLEPRTSPLRGLVMGYVVLHPDGFERIATPNQLRRLKSPRESLCRWEEVPYFNPTKVTA